MSDRTPPPDPGRDPYDRRDEWRYRDRHAAGRGAWFGGVVLLGLGLFFLARNFGVPLPDNWWAVFILIPAFGAFTAAWGMYSRNGRVLTSSVIGAAVGGVALTLLAVVFFMGLDIGKFWPVILIVLGAGVLLGNLRRPGSP